MNALRRLQILGLAFAVAGFLNSGCGEDAGGQDNNTGGPITGTTGGATAGTSGGLTGGSTGASTAGATGTSGGTTAGSSGGSTAGSTGGSTAGSSGGTTAGSSGGSTAGSSGGTTAGSSGGSTAGSSGGTTAGSSGGSTAGSTGGTSGGSTGGSTGTTGGMDDDAGTSPPGMSPGCGKTTFPASGMYNITVGTMQRMFIIKLPTGYDANKPYKLVFTWHYLGGSAQAVASSGYYGLEPMSAGSAIFVSPEGLNTSLGGKGWENAGGQDVAFAKAMADKFKNDYCIDTDRIFATGFSYGAIMSNTVGCSMGDVFRAIAPMSGSGPRGTCTGDVAVWISHGEADTMFGVTYANGQASRDFWAKANGCTTPGSPDANNCVTYQGCAADKPLIWCSVPGQGHQQPRFGSAEIWKFFSKF